MPRGKYVNHKGRNRHFTSPEELEQQRKEEQKNSWRKKKEEEDEEESESGEEASGDDQPKASGSKAKEAKAESGSDDDSEESDSDEEGKKSKGVEGLIQIENPNRVVKKQKKVTRLTEDAGDAKPELSRREREELEKQRARAHYQKLHAEGKTDEARADLARLALIRKQREEAAKKREEEQKAKEAAKAAKVAATGKALGK